MRTPRPHQSRSSRSAATLIGNGWLRESERNVARQWSWSPKSRSALRKCMLMEMPDDVAALAAQLPRAKPLPMPAWAPPRRAEEVVPHRRDPRKDARMFAAVDPAEILARAHRAPAGRAWWEDPVALGTLLILAPPIGLACVWRSKHYSGDARWALTVMTTLITCFAGAVVLALLFVR